MSQKKRKLRQVSSFPFSFLNDKNGLSYYAGTGQPQASTGCFTIRFRKRATAVWLRLAPNTQHRNTVVLQHGTATQRVAPILAAPPNCNCVTCVAPRCFKRAPLALFAYKAQPFSPSPLSRSTCTRPAGSERGRGGATASSWQLLHPTLLLPVLLL